MPGHRLVPRADSASVADRQETAGRTREEGEKGKVPMGRTREEGEIPMGRTREEGEKRKDVVAPIRVPFSRRERERDGVVERMTDLVQHTAAATVCAEYSCINRLEQRARGWLYLRCALFRKPSGSLCRTIAKDMVSSSYNQRDCVQISATVVGLLPRRLLSVAAA